MQKQAECIAKNIVNEKSEAYGGGPLKKPIGQLIGHKTYGFLVPEAMGVPQLIFMIMFPCVRYSNLFQFIVFYSIVFY